MIETPAVRFAKGRFYSSPIPRLVLSVCAPLHSAKSKLRQDVEWDSDFHMNLTDSGQISKHPTKFSGFCCVFVVSDVRFSNDDSAGSSQVGSWFHLFVQGVWAVRMGDGGDLENVFVFLLGWWFLKDFLDFFTPLCDEMTQFDEQIVQKWMLQPPTSFFFCGGWGWEWFKTHVLVYLYGRMGMAWPKCGRLGLQPNLLIYIFHIYAYAVCRRNV